MDFAEVLYDRPGLKVELASQFQVEREHMALVEMKFAGLLQKEKQEDLAGKSALGLSPVELGQEYGRYLHKAYKNAEFVRPRNVIGFLKEQTPAVMEQMLKDNITVTPGEIRLLAMQRGEAVAAILRKHGPVESERLFVLEPVAIQAGEPQVELRFQ